MSPATDTATVANSALTDLSLSNAAVAEEQASGAVVGVLTATDADAGDSFTYSLVGGEGSTDNEAFAIDAAGQLVTAVTFDYETQDSYSIRVQTSDQDGMSIEKVFVIQVTDVDETPTLPVQMVTGSPDSRHVRAGQTFHFDVQYATSDHDSTLTGLGLRIHYDSDFVSFAGLSDVLPAGFVQRTTLDDTADYDGDASTDKYVLVAWADRSGNWPNVALPGRLAKATFVLGSETETGVSSSIRFTASSTAAGYAFSSQGLTVTAVPVSLDINQDGKIEDAMDGELALRYLFGIRGPALTESVAPEADPDQIAEWLDSVRMEMLDVDGNSVADALTDGLLIRRYLSGLTGHEFVQDAVAWDATRHEPESIEEFLGSFVPGADWDDADFTALAFGRARRASSSSEDDATSC